jgi:SLT domain-containing protein
MYSRAPNKNPDPYTGYPIGSEQHRTHVQRLHEEAEKERRAIEDKLMRLRDGEMVRRKQKEHENVINSQNQNQYSNQRQYQQQQKKRQQQQQQEQQQQYQYHNNNHSNHDNDFQIMDQHTDHIRQPPQHPSSSSKSNNSNDVHERSHERYDGMIKSDSRSGKVKKLKSVIEIPRRIIKKSTFIFVRHYVFLLF